MTENTREANFKDHFLCGICYNQVTKEKEPVECSVCRNQVYCLACLENWSQSKPQQSLLECPYCSQVCKFVDVSHILLRLIIKCQPKPE